MFEKLDNRIIINYEVKALSDLHIGGHQDILPGELDLPVIKDADETPIIPGSSLKGILRQETIRFLRALRDSEKINIRYEGNQKKDNVEYMVENNLFGSQKYASSIKFRDGVADRKRIGVRDGVKIDIATRKAKGGAKFDMEVVPKGTSFSGEIIVENTGKFLNDDKNRGYAKLGALLNTIALFNATNRGIGGFTSRGFGEGVILIKEIREIKPDDYLNLNPEGKKYSMKSHVESAMEGKLPESEIIETALEDWKKYLTGD